MRDPMKVDCLHNPLCELAEGPLWHPEEEALYWTDINGRRIWRFIPENGLTEKVWEGPVKVGGFTLCRSGGFVLCTDGGIFTADAELAKWKILHKIELAGDERFNDITVDPRGRVFAGTLKGSLTEGTLYRIERDKEPVTVLRGIGVSNGMTFSLDEKTFFHTDSSLRRVTAFDYEAATGGISNPRLFYQGAESDGYPDGITMDLDGCIWAACWGASQVIRLDRRGVILERIPIPAIQPSSVIFGGSRMDRLFVTSAHEGSADPVRGLDGAGRFLGGHVYVIATKTMGRPEWKANLG
jgi:D-xylonolactonase